MAHEFILPYFPNPLVELFELVRLMFNEAAVDRGDDHVPSPDGQGDGGADGAGGDPDPEGEGGKPAKGKGAADADADGDGKDAGGSGDEDEDAGDKPILIPKHRYDSAAQRARDAEAQNAELRQELETLRGKPVSSGDGKDAQSPDDQLAELDRQIEQARADNNVDEVIRLGKEQRAIERAMYEEIAANTSTRAGKQAREQIQLDDVIDHLESSDSRFDPDSEDFDQELVDEVVLLQEGWVASGKYTPAQAMRRAAQVLAPPREAAPDPKPGRKTDVEKNLNAAKNIAPDTKDKGENSDKGGDLQDPSQVMEMSTDEFDALPEETKRRLRGDFV